MESLKKRFTPRPNENETIDTYLNLIYGEGDEENDDDKSTNDERNKAQQLVKTLYNGAKITLPIPDEIEDRPREEEGDGDLFHDLEGNYAQTNLEEDDDEVSRYMKLKDIRVKDDPIVVFL